MHHPSRRSQMRHFFKQADSSSTSLNGMERPVRSFKSFIKSVPPNPPAYNKPLPPAPSPSAPKTTKSPPLPISRPPLPARHTSRASWRAPAAWSFGTPGLTGSFRSSSTPLIPSNRKYSPLIPTPSPESTDMTMEVNSVPVVPSPPHEFRLLSISECPTSMVLDPHPTPSRLSLTSLPTFSSISETRPLIRSRRSPAEKRAETFTGCIPLQTEFLLRTASADSVTLATSNIPTNEKAYRSLGIGSPREQASTLDNELRESTSVQCTQPNHSYLQGKKLRALGKAGTLRDDSWEDTEMDDKTRQLSFSIDYHDLLADQYQDKSIQHNEEVQYGTLIDGDSNSSKSRERPENIPSHPVVSSTKQKRSSRKIASWVSYRLGVGHKRQVSERSDPKSPSESAINAKKGAKKGQKRIIGSGKDKEFENDLRFSRLFPSSKLSKSDKKANKQVNSVETDCKPAPLVPSPSDFAPAPAPVARLLTSLPVVHTTPSTALKSDTNSALTTPTSTSYRASSTLENSEHHTTSPASTSNATDNHPWYISYTSPTAPVVPTIAIRSASRESLASSRSGSRSSHPLAQEVLPPPLPPPHPATYLPASYPQSQSSKRCYMDATAGWRNCSIGTDRGWRKPGFLEKAKEARRRRVREARRNSLKKSIRVLGPTDPAVLESYVRGEGRLPGYMTG